VNWSFFFEKIFFDFSFSFQILSVDAAFHSVSRVFFSFHYFRNVILESRTTKAVAIKQKSSDSQIASDDAGIKFERNRN
jgi:hypothetical protein